MSVVKTVWFDFDPDTITCTTLYELTDILWESGITDQHWNIHYCGMMVFVLHTDEEVDLVKKIVADECPKFRFKGVIEHDL